MAASKLNPSDRDMARKTADMLMAAFVWRKTPQGREYWDKVHTNLMAIANRTEEQSDET